MTTCPAAPTSAAGPKRRRILHRSDHFCWIPWNAKVGIRTYLYALTIFMGTAPCPNRLGKRRSATRGRIGRFYPECASPIPVMSALGASGIAIDTLRCCRGDKASTLACRWRERASMSTLSQSAHASQWASGTPHLGRPYAGPAAKAALFCWSATPSPKKGPSRPSYRIALKT